MIGAFELLIILAVIVVFLAMVGGVVALVLWLNRRNGKSAPPPQPQSTAPTKRLCPQCGKEMLATDAPQGLCPNCLMKVAMGSEAGNPAAASVERKPAPPAEVIAKHFPQFEILTLLGQGGMGAVYKARQPALDRFVALKVLPAHAAADAGFAERFNREARALAKLSHPNIVAVYEFGQADGLHYLIMEFVDGLNLRQLQQTGRLPPREALEIIPQICEALQFAHDEGVVHRDIKPENVMLDKKGRVKIADFGLARILGREPESFRLTGTKDYMGTPHYMAPEQIERPQAVDHRADIYSLGVVFYEMLTGELPLGKFQAPSKKVHMDVRLDEVVLHALEKEPERRYQHASEVKTDVEMIAHTQGAALSAPATAEVAAEAARVESAWRQVKGPAMGLVVTGILNWIAIPLVVIVTAAIVGGKEFDNRLLLLVPLAALVFSSVMFIAGLKMKRLETYGLAVAGSVLAMLVTPGNLIGMPLGIWSLVVLCNREVRQAFGKGFSRSLSPDELPHTGRGTVAWRVAAVVGAVVIVLFLAVSVSALLYFMARANNARELARRAETAAVADRTAAMSNSMARLAPSGALPSPEVAESPELRAAREKLSELRRSYTDEHSSVQALLQWIEDLEQQAVRSRSSSAFGPVIERVIPDFESLEPPKALKLLVGEVSAIPTAMLKANDQTAAREWAITNRMLAFINFGGDSRGLSCVGWKFGDLPETAWDQALPDSLGPALDAGTSLLKPKQIGSGGVAFEIPQDVRLPLSLAFETSLRDRGIMQIVGITRQPRSVKLRYKLLQSTLPSPTGSQVDQDSRRKFVRIVVDTTKMTFEGQQTTWEDMGTLLANVADRANTVLELAVTSDQITVAQQNEWFQKSTALARQHGFEYASFIGIHPLGSKGDSALLRQSAQPTTEAKPGVSKLSLTNSVEQARSDMQATRNAIPTTNLTNQAVFRPVIERTLSGAGDARQRYIDLDTGQQFAASDFLEANAESRPEEARRWYEQHGIDAEADTISADVGLVGFDLLSVPVPRQEWDMSPARLDYYLATAKPGTPITMSAKGDKTNTFAFRTREGGRGLLRIVGFVEGPPRILWIRYKLAQAGSNASGTPAPQAKADDVADVPSVEHFAGGDTNQLYYLITRSEVSAASTNPSPLLLVLPGGDGGRDFQPFIKRICKNALPDGYLVVQLIAPKWDDNQFANLVWPTEESRYPAMKFSTEAFVNSVIADIEKQHRLDSRRIFTLSWSSGGPAAYAISLHPDTSVTGSFIAMSVFKPDQLPEATAAKGHAYYLLHSPQDFIPMRMPELARDTLTSHGAEVHLQTYQGGHGWHGNVFGMIGEGIRWLEQQTTSRSAPPVGADSVKPVTLNVGGPLPFTNTGMEEGSDHPAAWLKGSPVAGVEQTWDRTTAHGGTASLCLKKTVQRFFPIAQWSQSVMVESSDQARKVRVRCWVKAEKVTKAILDVTYQGKQSGHMWAVFLGQKEQTDPVANHDWKLCEGIVEVPAQTSRLGIAFQIYGPGAVWFDDLEVAWIE